MAKPPLYFVTTRNCNLKCRHCYLEAGPGNLDTTISPEDFKAAVGNLPKKSIKLLLSGGEVFTIQDNLFSYLESIQEENIERNYNQQELIVPGVQTNGSWAVNDKKIESTLDKLISFGVGVLDIASNDKFHKEQGIKKKNLKPLYKQAKKRGLTAYLRGVWKSEVLPLGRAKEMKVGHRYLRHKANCLDFLENPSYTIREDGKVYPCCFGLHPLAGNIIEEPLDAIVEKTKKDERLNVLSYEGIRQLAIYDGRKKAHVERMIASYGECGLCAKLYAP